jgi:polysaccharide biosynthesis protein PelG
MAGIGFVLRRLADRDDIAGNAAAWGAAAAITSGPWLMTIAAILAAEHWGAVHVQPWEHERFRTVLAYNFCFSLVFTAPFALLATRLAADDIFLRRPEGLSAGFLQALLVALAVQALPVLLVWGVLTELPPTVRLMAIANYAVLVGVWVLLAYLSVLRDFGLILIAFLLGLTLAAGLAAVFGMQFGAAGLLASFTLGLAVLLMLGAARLLIEFPWVGRPWRETRQMVAPYIMLGPIGLLTAAAPWVDKWVLWLSPSAEISSSGLPNLPAYDSAMFLACLAIVPGIALFFVAMETEIFTAWRRFFDQLRRGASLGDLEELRIGLAGSVAHAGVVLLLLQGLVAVSAILAGPLMVQAGLLTPAQHPIFRFAVLGAPFHTVFLAVLIVLAYLDARRAQLIAAAGFFLANACFTAALRPLGPEWFGYSYLMAAIFAAALACALLAHELHRLIFLVFIRNNPAIQAAS